MLIFQRRTGVVHTEGTARFPSEVTIQAKLSPPELFNGGRRSHKLPFHPPGSTMTATLDPLTNETRMTSPGTFAPISFDTTLFAYALEVKDGTATLRSRCESEAEFLRAVEFVCTCLPAFLAASVPAPVSVHDISGAIGAAIPFEVTFPRTSENLLMTADGPTLSAYMADYLHAVGALQGDVSRLTAAHRYLLQCRQLGFASDSLHQFLGERLLNLAKALQSLFPQSSEQSVEELREELRKLQVDTRLVEMFASVIYLRNQLDVGHPAMMPLSQQDFDRVVRFTGRAEHAFAGLLRHVIAEMQAGRYELAALPPPKEKHVRSRAGTLAALIPHDEVTVYPYGPAGSLRPARPSVT